MFVSIPNLEVVILIFLHIAVKVVPVKYYLISVSLCFASKFGINTNSVLCVRCQNSRGNIYKMSKNESHLIPLVSKKIQAGCKGSMSPPEIRLLPSGCILPERFLQYEQRIRDMEVRENDVWVCSYPKSGTTWTQEMVWLLGNGFNFEKAKSQELSDRFPFLELVGLWPVNDTDQLDTVTLVENMASPRFIKSHLPTSLLPKKLFEVNPKIIYVTRNPKSVAVSYFYHFQMMNNYSGTKEDIIEAFIQDKMIFSPYWEHVLGFWKLRDRQNILIISYEEMKANLSEVIKKTAKFLGVSYNEDQEKELLKHLSFGSMRKNRSVNMAKDLEELGKADMHWVRKGETNSWKDDMSPDMAKRFDSWTREKLKDSDFPSYLKNEK